MQLLFAAKSGWGKSYHGQGYIEASIPKYERCVILDYKDEYRGLVKAGFCRNYIIGPVEHQTWDDSDFRQLIERGERLQLPRYRLDDDQWREVCDQIIRVAREMRDVLIIIDEAHFVAPQDTKLPSNVKGLATTGRGEQASAIWLTQRLTEIDSTVVSQADAYMLGGFGSDADLKKLRNPLDYTPEIHNPGGTPLDPAAYPEQLHAEDAGAITLRKWTDPPKDPDGDVIGSEWIYSDDSGAMERISTKGMEMESTHFGPQGKGLNRPSYA
ncbi:ATP-binding protein [Haloferax namakaokahaiae]|uniref:ATP-binding protein n=1 Tax=Haloferax namakaokahaiae TaxID=1748331 RepID=A0ABD5ZHF6_9EURY